MNELAVLDVVLEDELRRDDSLVFLATSTPPQWRREFGEARIRTCAISEQAMVGAAVGAAMTGLRPVVDLNRASFSFLVMDQLVNHAARLHYLTDGGYRAPMVVTSATRGRQQLGPQNEQCPYGVFMQVPGIRVAVPGTAEDACALLRSAVRENGPVMLFIAPELARGANLRTALTAPPVPFGEAVFRHRGDAATVVAIGGAVRPAVEGVAALAAQGVDCDLIDPRTLVPLDVEALASSLRRTGRLVLVDDGPRSGAPAQILSALYDVPGLPEALGGRVAFVCAPDSPVPSTPALEQYTWPEPQAVAAAVRRLAEPRP
ncbi:transketolase C-terminal domain-containing protein [Kitasatospora phosalacinea]|uniref:Transketolase C-terminal domain-containing protein n=1 Tax=Kitasatospora phosalacinea TaxID=2065 RepID=A0ABW6GL56_9ACTN